MEGESQSENSKVGVRERNEERRQRSTERQGEVKRSKVGKSRERLSVSESVRESGVRCTHTDTQQVGDRSAMQSGEQVQVTAALPQAENHTKVFVELSHTLVLFVCVLSWLWFSEVVACESSADCVSARCVLWSGMSDCDKLVRTGTKMIVAVHCTESDLKGRTGRVGRNGLPIACAPGIKGHAKPARV